MRYHQEVSPQAFPSLVGTDEKLMKHCLLLAHTLGPLESKEYWWERLLSTWRKSWEHTLSACPLRRTTEIQLVNVFCKALNNTETSGRGNRLLQFAQSISHYLFNSHSHVIFLNCFHSIESMKAPWPRYLSLTLAKSSCLEISRAAWANQMQYCQNHIQLLL